MIRTNTTCPARHHFRTHGLRHALATLAVVAGGGLLPLVGAAASTLPVQDASAAVTQAAPVATFEVQPEARPIQSAPVLPIALQPAPAQVTRDSAALPGVSGKPVGVGEASFYGKGDGFAGRKTANGEIFDPSAMTAAHKTLPLGTRLKVTNLANSRSVLVRVNDRGPYAKGRILDLSYGAAQRLGMVGAGHARVKLERL
jgi:rare lipoprotein A